MLRPRPEFAPGPPLAAADPRLDRLRRLARVLDAAYRIPGTRWRFGIDGILGLIPGVGDVVTTALASWIVIEARRLGVRKRTLGRMALNVGIDFLVGSIPVLGDVFDVGWKANTRNLRLLEESLERAKRPGPARRP